MSAVTEGLVAGRYRVGRVLGRGGMADVYEGHDERLARDVAIKMLRPDVVARHPEVIARFEAEARSAAGLAQSNVVAIFDTGEHDGRPYIVMERMPGETMAQRMANGPVDLDWLRRVAGDVLAALGAAHDAGIVHRDIKPGNILIANDGCAKVADFGIAKSLDSAAPDLTGTNLLVGTPAYMAPERVGGEPATAQADIYSLGVVLYEAAAGRKPFTGTTPVAVAYAIRQGEAEPLTQARPDMEQAFAAVVTQAMAIDPGARFASAAAMANALGVAGDDTTLPVVAAAPDETMTMAAPSPARAGVAPWWARRQVRVAALAVLALLLVLAVVASAGGNDRSGGQEPATATSAPETPATTRVTAPPTTERPAQIQVQVGGDRQAPAKGKGAGKGDKGGD